MSVTYCACFGNVTLGEIRPDINGRQLEQKLASKQKTSSLQSKVIELVRALKYIAGVPRRNQKGAVRWSSIIFALPIQKAVNQSC